MPDSIDRLLQIDLTRFGTYSPCKSPEVLARRLGMRAEEIIKLDANENPYGCSPKVQRALANYGHLHIYPDAAQSELREYIAGYTEVSPEHIVAGNGSDELIDLLLRLFVAPGDEVITLVPTFDMYRFCTEVCRGKTVEVLRGPDFQVDVAAVKAAITPRTRLIFVTNPNNPTGTLTPREDILALLDTGLPVVVDEAYFEFSQMTVGSEVIARENLIVLRTFSKWAGLAGLRVGYGIFPKNVAGYLMKIKPPYNVNVAAEVAVRESIRDTGYLVGSLMKIKEERPRMFEALSSVNYLKPIPSRGNFILCEVLKGKASLIQQELEDRGILIRYYNTPLLRNYIRISVGKPEHTGALVNALQEIGERNKW
jgi:histidinol-phosphate aminotransferase